MKLKKEKRDGYVIQLSFSQNYIEIATFLSGLCLTFCFLLWNEQRIHRLAMKFAVYNTKHLQ